MADSDPPQNTSSLNEPDVKPEQTSAQDPHVHISKRNTEKNTFDDSEVDIDTEQKASSRIEEEKREQSNDKPIKTDSPSVLSQRRCEDGSREFLLNVGDHQLWIPESDLPLPLLREFESKSRRQRFSLRN